MLRILFVLVAGGIALPAFAAEAMSSVDLVESAMTKALDSIFSDLQNQAVRWLFGFIVIQFAITHSKQLFTENEPGAIIGKAVLSFSWAGFCLYIFQEGPGFIKAVASFFLSKGAGMAGGQFDAAYPTWLAINIASDLLNAVDKGGGILANFNPFPSMMMGLVSLVILAVGAVIGFKVLMIFIETKIVIALSPMSFAFLGLNALRDQGIVPLKYLISMAYRCMIYAAILAAMTALGSVIQNSFASLPAASDPKIWKPLWAATIGYVLLGALAWRTDSIAAMLSSGTSQMTTGDAAATAATAAAAGGLLGAMAGGPLGYAANAARNTAQGMSSVISQLRSDSGPRPDTSRLDSKFAGGSGTAASGSNNGALSMSQGGTTGKNGAPVRGAGDSGGFGIGRSESGSASASGSAASPSNAMATHGGASSSAPAGSGATAGISGAAPGPSRESGMGTGQQSAFGRIADRMSDVNQEIQRDQFSGVGVHINTHAD